MQCLRENADILKPEIAAEHHEILFGDPEGASSETLVEILSNLERKKLTYRERLSPHGWRIVRMVLREKKLVPFV